MVTSSARAPARAVTNQREPTASRWYHSACSSFTAPARCRKRHSPPAALRASSVYRPDSVNSLLTPRSVATSSPSRSRPPLSADEIGTNTTSREGPSPSSIASTRSAPNSRVTRSAASLSAPGVIGWPTCRRVSTASSSGLPLRSSACTRTAATVGGLAESAACSAVRRRWCSAQASALTDQVSSRCDCARAAAMPAWMLAPVRSKARKSALRRSGVTSTSRGVSSRSERCTFCSVRMPIICCAMPKALVSTSGPPRGVPTLTAITTSAPSWRARSTGRLRTRPPSPSGRPSTVIGVNAPGTAIEARIAVNSGTSTGITISPFSMSVATARYTSGNWCTWRSDAVGVSRRSSRSTSLLVKAPPGGASPSRVMPSSIREDTSASSSRRRTLRVSRAGRSCSTRPQSVASTIRSSSATSAPPA